MTYREAYFSLQKLDNKFLNNTVIKELLIDVGGFDSYFTLLKHFDEQISNVSKYENNLLRLQNGEPLQYVLGKAYFVNSYYEVTPDVLIPRQETEQLAVGAFSYIQKRYKLDDKFSICDLCTGSGILGIYLKEKFPNACVYESDISEKALEIAKKNAKNHHVLINFLNGDFLKPLIENNLKFDVLVCNPPYIGSKDTVDPQTLKYEPHVALFANPDYKFYETIFANIDLVMNNAYILAFEIGEDMEEKLTELVELYLPGVLYKFERDIYNKVRFLYIMKK